MNKHNMGGGFLLDTHVFLWMLHKSPAVPDDVYDVCANAEVLYLSSISAWEISVKYAAKKLPLPKPPDVLIPEARALQSLLHLPFTEEDAFILSRLPALHKDPCDRMLICQTIKNNLTLITSDKVIRQYPIKTVW